MGEKVELKELEGKGIRVDSFSWRPQKDGSYSVKVLLTVFPDPKTYLREYEE